MKTRIESLEEFLAEDPDDSFSRYALALELVKEGREHDALKELQTVLEGDPNYVAVYYQLGRLLALAGRTDEAREIYQRGIEVASLARDQRTKEELQMALDTL
jgi:tetratricopeptide (TPR) repeat protein